MQTAPRKREWSCKQAWSEYPSSSCPLRYLVPRTSVSRSGEPERLPGPPELMGTGDCTPYALNQALVLHTQRRVGFLNKHSSPTGDLSVITSLFQFGKATLLWSDSVISYAEAVSLCDSSMYCIPGCKYESQITERKMQINPFHFYYYYALNRALFFSSWLWNLLEINWTKSNWEIFASYKAAGFLLFSGAGDVGVVVGAVGFYFLCAKRTAEALWQCH